MIFEDYRQQLARNIEVIKQVDEDTLPHLYWFLSKYNGIMLKRLIRFIEMLHGIDKQTLVAPPSMWVAFASIRHIGAMGRDITRDFIIWHSTIIQFIALGLIYRHIPTQADEGNRYMVDSLRRQPDRPIHYYGVPPYTPNRLMAADTKARQLRYSKVSTSKLDKATVIKIWGQATANTIYQDSREESPESQEISQALVNTAQTLIKEKGYTTKRELLAEVSKNLHADKIQVQRLYDKRGRRILHDSSIRYHAPTNQDRERYHLHRKEWIFSL